MGKHEGVFVVVAHTAIDGSIINETISDTTNTDTAFAGGVIAVNIFGRAYIEHTWVEPQHRGHGLGSQLMQALEDKIVNAGLTGIDTDTFSFQALGFYLRCGFQQVGLMSGYQMAVKRYFLSKNY